MLFNTIQYLIFLPFVVLIYYLLPAKARYIWLLIASYYFYMQWNALYVLLLLFSTITTYVCGFIIGKINESEKKSNSTINWQKICLVICILLNLSILFFYKYLYFGLACINQLLTIFGWTPIVWEINILLPVGISFYTLQALGYLIDVYRKDIYAEKNFLKYALFVSFFPQLVAGPIERTKNLLVQLKEKHRFEYGNLRQGFYFVLYGLFIKMVIADRAAVIVDTVYNNPVEYPGFYIVFATIVFAIQIYCDFYGYSIIARGSALMMGIQLISNFEAPYFSKSVKEFWRRWHISLSNWFRDYLYIPLGGNRKGEFKKERNLFLVFMVSGLWHGASLGYIVWGCVNGLYVLDPFDVTKRKKELTKQGKFILKNKVGKFLLDLMQIVITFLLVTFAWIFFRAGGWRTSLTVLLNMLRINNYAVLFNGSLLELGVSGSEMIFFFISILVLAFVDYFKYQGKNVMNVFLQQRGYVRYLVFAFLFFGIILFGCYGEVYNAQQFIYFQF